MYGICTEYSVLPPWLYTYLTFLNHECICHVFFFPPRALTAQFFVSFRVARACARSFSRFTRRVHECLHVDPPLLHKQTFTTTAHLGVAHVEPRKNSASVKVSQRESQGKTLNLRIHKHIKKSKDNKHNKHNKTISSEKYGIARPAKQHVTSPRRPTQPEPLQPLARLTGALAACSEALSARGAPPYGGGGGDDRRHRRCRAGF